MLFYRKQLLLNQTTQQPEVGCLATEISLLKNEFLALRQRGTAQAKSEKFGLENFFVFAWFLVECELYRRLLQWRYGQYKQNYQTNRNLRYGYAIG